MSEVRLRHAARPIVEKCAPSELLHVDLDDVEPGATGGWTPVAETEREGEGLRVRVGDVAYGRLRPYLRKTFLADRDLTCSTEFMVLRPRPGWDSRFLAYCVRDQAFAAAVTGLVEGAKMPRASWNEVRKLPMPGRSLDSQMRVADFLDRECERITFLGKAWDAQHDALEGLRESATREAVGELRQAPLKRVAEIIDCKHRTAEYTEVGWPIISTREVRRGELVVDESTRRVSTADFHDLRDIGRDPRVGDIIYSRNASVGVAVFLGEPTEVCMGQDVVLITRRPRDCELLAFVLNWGVADQVEQRSIGSTFSRINVPTIRELVVPNDTPEREQAVLTCLRQTFLQLDRVEKELTGASRQLTQYRDALITEAVTGKLDVTRLSDQQLDESAQAAMEGERREVRI